jgi:hypothetical protein
MIASCYAFLDIEHQTAQDIRAHPGRDFYSPRKNPAT